MSNSRSGKIHLDYLDGMRGLAAFFVLISHLHGAVFEAMRSRHQGPSAALEYWTGWMEHGRDAVAVFIVLSGFSLMLPLAASGATSIRGGIRNYLQRRARRILPAYYATVVLATALTLLAHHFKHGLGVGGDSSHWSDNVSTASLLSHAVLIHNFSPNLIFTIEPPLWSVAVEWQIYFFLPLLLVPIWRRFGILATLGIALLLGLGPHFLLSPNHNLDWSAPWFLGLFTFGLAGALIAFAAPYEPLRNAVPWGSAALLLAVLTYVVLGQFLNFRPQQMVMDLGIGLSTAAFVIFGAASELGASSLPIRLLSSQAFKWLGACSYSLYLTHGLILSRLRSYASTVHCSNTVFIIGIWAAGISIPLIFGYIFHKAFERPFLARSYMGSAAKV